MLHGQPPAGVEAGPMVCGVRPRLQLALLGRHGAQP